DAKHGPAVAQEILDAIVAPPVPAEGRVEPELVVGEWAEHRLHCTAERCVRDRQCNEVGAECIERRITGAVRRLRRWYWRALVATDGLAGRDYTRQARGRFQLCPKGRQSGIGERCGPRGGSATGRDSPETAVAGSAEHQQGNGLAHVKVPLPG